MSPRFRHLSLPAAKNFQVVGVEMPTIIAKPRCVRFGPLRLDRGVRHVIGATGHCYHPHDADSQATKYKAHRFKEGPARICTSASMAFRCRGTTTRRREIMKATYRCLVAVLLLFGLAPAGLASAQEYQGQPQSRSRQPVVYEEDVVYEEEEPAPRPARPPAAKRPPAKKPPRSWEPAQPRPPQARFGAGPTRRLCRRGSRPRRALRQRNKACRPPHGDPRQLSIR